jgi:imidazolonepropionase
MFLIRDLSQIVTLESALKKDGRRIQQEDLSIIKDAAIAYQNDKILWVGRTKEIPKEYKNFNTLSLPNKIMLPGFSDCHTHTVFAGNRANEYTRRLSGEDYQKIANEGGGILSTVGATQKSSADDLFNSAVKRINQMHQRGVKSLEIKSGYGLTKDSELKILQVIKRLKSLFDGKVRIFTTFMGAHAVPEKFNSSNEYIAQEVLPILEEATPDLFDAVDIFHEQGYFNDVDAVQLFEVAIKKNKSIRMHADEFNDNNGANLAMKYHALSCDHLMKINLEGIENLGRSKTVAVVLPGTSLFLGKEPAPINKLIEANAKVAISTDFNPGSCHFSDLALLAKITAPRFKLNIGQLITSITLNPAHSLGFLNEGSLISGMYPSFSLFNVNSLDEFVYDWSPTEQMFYFKSDIFE